MSRERLIELMQTSGLDTADVARILTEQTMRPCSRRTVQAWLSEPGKPSSRPCPEWAVTILEVRLKTTKGT